MNSHNININQFRIIPAVILLFFLQYYHAKAQEIKGSVYEMSKEKHNPLPGANVFWAGSTTGTTTTQSGEFSLSEPESYPAVLVASFIGFNNDSIKLSNKPTDALHFVLKSTINLKTVEVVEYDKSTKISTMSPIHVETIGAKELQKAACCNLAESFETNASVDVTYTDAVSGARKIQMLGLDGSYTQIMFENLPYIRGLSSSYGLSYVPGTWIESIQVNKGAGSVVNGYESITGQINLEMNKPQLSEKFYLNVYGNHQGRGEINIHTAQKLNTKWSTLIMAHGSEQFKKVDNNKDGFLDQPLRRQINFFNRWHYRSGNHEAQFGVRGLTENLSGGQTGFDYSRDFGKNNFYGIGVGVKQLEAFAKKGFLFDEQPYKSIGLLASSRYHTQQSYFGNKTYSGEQTNAYFNSIYQTIISNTSHKVRTGISYLYDSYNETYNDSAFSRTESVPGVYGEYSYGDDSKFSAVAGTRVDFHNLYGTRISPRLHLKYNFLPLSAIRLSAGKGFRMPNILVENASVLASSRNVRVEDVLNPESAWNYGTTLTHKFRFLNRDAVVSLDYFRTEFENMVVTDLENPDYVRFYNLKGKAYANSFQAEVSYEPFKRMEVKAAYKIYDVKVTYDNRLLAKPFVARNRAFFNTGYSTAGEKWKFDITVQWFGNARIPSTFKNDPEFRLASWSPSYFITNAQITRSFKKWDAYLGGENIFNFMMPAPILDAQNPFGSNFDASMIWGPVMGRVVYGGIRFKIK